MSTFRYPSRTALIGFKSGKLVVEKTHAELGFWIARCTCGKTVRTTEERLRTEGPVQMCKACHEANWKQGAQRRKNKKSQPTLRNVWPTNDKKT